jgi:hypothetical protein
VGKLIVYAVLAVLVWRLASGRWPWEKKESTRRQAVARARTLLGVRANANRAEIIEAHRRLLVRVHPDRGGTNDQVHEANAARDLLLDALPDR